MCGIAVAVDWDDAESAVAALLHGIRHRGDTTDPIVSPRPNTALGTRRLRIVDRDRAIQPQVSFDGRLILCFNGEIYNHEAIRRELETLGVPFRTESDTEVLANALQVWGAKALGRLNGMFAFVALDIESGAFLAARDPMGVKPLYVVQSPTGWLFCSEIRPLLSVVEAGDVLMIPPGHLLSRQVCAPFHSAIENGISAKKAFEVRDLDRLLMDAVSVRLPSGWPSAVSVSGGIDSTLVAHYARLSRPDTVSYFLGSPDAPDYAFVQDYAELSAADVRVIPFSPVKQDLLQFVNEGVFVSESFEPCLIRGAVCSIFLSAALRRDGYRVALCGDGADELFAGYEILEEAFDANPSAGEALRTQCLEEMHRTCLQRIDRAGMRFQLEMREPFLDPRVISYAGSLDPAALVDRTASGPRGKRPLRELYDLYPSQLPRSIRDRQKLPFDVGAGLGSPAEDVLWTDLFETEITDAELADAEHEFKDFGVTSKEELYCLRSLSTGFDVHRVPHLRGRVRVVLPAGYTPKETARKSYTAP